jgi:hypothetical protein
MMEWKPSEIDTKDTRTLSGTRLEKIIALAGTAAVSGLVLISSCESNSDAAPSSETACTVDIEPGDTLSDIAAAAENTTSPVDIQIFNGRPNSYISVGDEIKLTFDDCKKLSDSKFSDQVRMTEN